MEQVAKKMGVTVDELFNIVKDSEYSPEGWLFKSNIGSIRLGMLYDFYRELILDGKIPLSCISGIQIMCDSRYRANFEISHMSGIKESLLDIVKHLQLSVFPAGNGIEYGYSGCVKGRINLSDLRITVNAEERKSLIKSYAFTCTENIVLNVRMSTNTGKTRMSDNAKICTEDTHLPLTTNHSVGNYINIHALNGNFIRHTVDTNMIDFDAFGKYFINYLLSGSKNAEEKQVNINDIFNAMHSLVDPRYKKSWQQFTDNFYDKYQNNQYTLEHFKRVYAGKSRRDSVSRISAVKGVSVTSAEYFLSVYLEQYLSSEWVL